jgi:IS605 OrfB family transposase
MLSANPRFFRSEEHELAKAQRKLSAERKGPVVWYRRLRVVQHIHERIGNKRLDFIHKESRKLVDCFGVIAFEDLNVKGMQQKGNLAKSIGWSMFINATRCKAEEAGSKVVLVSPNGTLQICSRHGLTVKKDLSERTRRCGRGLVLDRDLNASINILRLGLHSLSQMGIEAHTLQGGIRLVTISNGIPLRESTQSSENKTCDTTAISKQTVFPLWHLAFQYQQFLSAQKHFSISVKSSTKSQRVLFQLFNLFD